MSTRTIKPALLGLTLASVLALVSCTDDYEVRVVKERLSTSSSVNTVVSLSYIQYYIRNRAVSCDLEGEVYLRSNTGSAVSDLRFYVNDSLVFTAPRLSHDGEFFLHDINADSTFVFRTSYRIGGMEKCDTIK